MKLGVFNMLRHHSLQIMVQPTNEEAQQGRTEGAPLAQLHEGHLASVIIGDQRAISLAHDLRIPVHPL